MKLLFRLNFVPWVSPHGIGFLQDKKNAFSLIEIMLAVAIFAVFIPAFLSSLHFSLQATSEGENKTQAYAIAQKNMEAIELLKSKTNPDWDWETTPINTDPDEFYQPYTSGNDWKLGIKTKSPADPEQNYISKVQIQAISRDPDGSYNFTGTGTLDSNSRLIIVSVEWKENGVFENVELRSIVSKY